MERRHTSQNFFFFDLVDVAHSFLLWGFLLFLLHEVVVLHCKLLAVLHVSVEMSPLSFEQNLISTLGRTDSTFHYLLNQPLYTSFCYNSSTCCSLAISAEVDTPGRQRIRVSFSTIFWHQACPDAAVE